MSLIKLNDNAELLFDIFNNDIIVFEDIQGAKIWVNWDGHEFKIKPKNLNNDNLNLIDLSLQIFYNPAIDYLNSLSPRVKGLMPKKWWFCFEYFPDEQPANIEYQRVPRHGLVLTSINKSGKYNYTVDEVGEYARLLDVDCLPVLFQGRLSDNMKQAIEYFLATSEDDIEYVFGEQNFGFFFYKMLSPSSKNSFLMDVEDGNKFQDNIEKFIIRLIDKDVSFEILNPLYTKMSSENSTEFVEVYTLILVNFLTFCQSVNIEDIKIKGNNREELYIYLMSKLFNIYIGDVKDDIENFEFVVPEFFNKDKFKINKELIENKLTKEYLDESDKLEYIFKVILGSFNKKRKKAIGIFTDNTVILFNKFVDDVNEFLDYRLNKMREREVTRSGLMNFGDYFDISYDVDGAGEVYIGDVWDKLAGENKKKKKKPGGIIKKGDGFDKDTLGSF